MTGCRKKPKIRSQREPGAMSIRRICCRAKIDIQLGVSGHGVFLKKCLNDEYECKSNVDAIT